MRKDILTASMLAVSAFFAALPVVAAPVQISPGSLTAYKSFPNLAASGGPGCTSQGVTWTVGGNTCSGSSGPTPNSTIKPVASTGANSGLGNFTCNGLTNTYTFSASGSTCAPPPPSDCPSQNLSWTVGGNTCTGSVGSTTAGGTASIAATGTNTGTGNFTCNAATSTYSFNATGSSCSVPAPVSCTSKPLSWTVSGVTCSASSGTTSNGASKTISSTNGQSGSATFTCNSTTDTYTQGAGATCVASNCSAQSLNWVVGGLTCTGSAGATSNAATTTVNNTTAGRVGSATFTCNGATNAYTGPAPGASCATAATACTDKSVSWTQGSNTCTAQSGTTSNGTTKTVTTTTASRLGSASITCNASTDTYTVAAGGTCYPSACTSQTINWTVGGTSCSGSTGEVNNSTSVVVNHTPPLLGPAITGSVTATCNSQTNTYAQSGATCSPPPANCASQNVSWTVSSNTCSGTASATNHNATRTVSAGGGSATFTCNNGSFTGPAAGATCPPQPPAGCAATTLNWSVGGISCSAATSSRASGTTFTISSSTSNLGQATYTCTNGVYSAPSSATCVSPFLENATQVYTFGTSACAILSGGSVKCWGSGFGSRPVSVQGMTSGITKLAANSNALCGLTNSGGVVCRGNNVLINGSDQYRVMLGDGSAVDFRNEALPVADITGATDIFSGDLGATQTFICAAVSGTSKCWGGFFHGITDAGTRFWRSTPFDVPHASDMKSTFFTTCSSGVDNCKATVTSYNEIGAKPTMAIRNIVTGGNHWCAINSSTNGALCWGRGLRGQLGHGVRVGESGGSQGVPAAVTPQSLGSNVKQVYAYADNSCAITNSGVLSCWGEGMGINSATPVTMITSGVSSFVTAKDLGYSLCVRMSDNTISCFNPSGVDLTPYPNRWYPMPNSSSYSDFSHSQYFNTDASSLYCGVTSAGRVQCWGSNEFGQVGDGTTTDRTSPVDVVGG